MNADMSHMPVLSKSTRLHSTKVVVLREEFVALTGDPLVAIVLNQLLYWTQRVKDFDLFLKEEQFFNPECNVSLRHGWIYKTAHELVEETMLCVDRTTMRRYLKLLITEGWLEERANPHNKWDKTSQYRLNLRKLQEDLLDLGFDLPGIDSFLEKDSLRKRHLPHLLQEKDHSTGASSLKESLLDEDTASSRECLSNEESGFAKKLSLSSSLSEELPSSLDQFQLGQSPLGQSRLGGPADKSASDKSADESVAREMVDLWEQHIVQKLFPENWKGRLQLTEDRKDRLESLFSFHFKNDIRLWERFCLRIKAAPFLMGESPSGWSVTLDWILKDGNLFKILEGNYDDPHRAEQEDFHKDSSQGGGVTSNRPNLIRDAEKTAIVASIKDPTWKAWCTQLAEGVRLNEGRMLHEPLSATDLKQIANARFLECEDERLVWVESPDSNVLRKIDDLRLKISWVFAQQYPKARTFRTRLAQSGLVQAHPTQASPGQTRPGQAHLVQTGLDRAHLGQTHPDRMSPHHSSHTGEVHA